MAQQQIVYTVKRNNNNYNNNNNWSGVVSGVGLVALYGVIRGIIAFVRILPVAFATINQLSSIAVAGMPVLAFSAAVAIMAAFATAMIVRRVTYHHYRNTRSNQKNEIGLKIAVIGSSVGISSILCLLFFGWWGIFLGIALGLLLQWLILLIGWGGGVGRGESFQLFQVCFLLVRPSIFCSCSLIELEGYTVHEIKLQANNVVKMLNRMAAYVKQAGDFRQDELFCTNRLLKIQHLLDKRIFTPREAVFEIFYLFFPIKKDEFRDEFIRAFEYDDIEDIVLLHENTCAVVGVFLNQQEVSIMRDGLKESAEELLFRFDKTFPLTLVDTEQNISIHPITYSEVKEKVSDVFKLILEFYKEIDVYPERALRRYLEAFDFDCGNYIIEEQVKYAADKIANEGLLSLEEEEYIDITTIRELNSYFPSFFGEYTIIWLKNSFDFFRAFIYSVFTAKVPLSDLHIAILFMVVKRIQKIDLYD